MPTTRTVRTDCPLDALEAEFHQLRTHLLMPHFASYRHHAVSFWVKSEDQYLPQQLIRRPLSQLLDAEFQELLETPGVGPVKLRNFLAVLQRVTQTSPQLDGGPATDSELLDGEFDRDWPQHPYRVDLRRVDEFAWEQWRARIEEFGLLDLTLGHVSPSLRLLPTVLWDTPLGAYAPHSLAHIRALPTHGPKRYRGIVEVLHSVYQRLETAQDEQDARQRLRPPLEVQLEAWTQSQILSPLPDRIDWAVQEGLVPRLLTQIEIDLGTEIRALAERRLGIDGAPVSASRLATELVVTRARVYQILQDVTDVLRRRWPTGSSVLDELSHRPWPTTSQDAVRQLVIRLQRAFFRV